MEDDLLLFISELLELDMPVPDSKLTVAEYIRAFVPEHWHSLARDEQLEIAYDLLGKKIILIFTAERYNEEEQRTETVPIYLLTVILPEKKSEPEFPFWMLN